MGKRVEGFGMDAADMRNGLKNDKGRGGEGVGEMAYEVSFRGRSERGVEIGTWEGAGNQMRFLTALPSRSNHASRSSYPEKGPLLREVGEEYATLACVGGFRRWAWCCGDFLSTLLRCRTPGFVISLPENHVS